MRLLKVRAVVGMPHARGGGSRAGQMQQILSPKMNGCPTVASGQTGKGWTAIVLAGQRLGVDPPALAFDQTDKTLVQGEGQSMLARVLRGWNVALR